MDQGVRATRAARLRVTRRRLAGKRAGSLLLAGLLAMAGLQVSTSAIATTVAARADADADVATGHGPKKGSRGTLRILNDRIVSYLRFSVPTPPAGEAIVGATLRVYAISDGSCAFGAEVMQAASNSWRERTIRWRNQPGTTGPVLATATWTAEGYQSFDVTSAVTGSGAVSFVLRHAEGCDAPAPDVFLSREAAANPPQLVVETDTLSPPDPSPPSPPPPGDAVEVAAAGDIVCDPTGAKFAGSDPQFCQHRATADLLEGMDAVLVPGDLQYPDGTLEQFQQGYDLSWGQYADVTYPVPGNHEYHVADAPGYFDYWASKSRSTGTDGYYSFDLGTWHAVALNTSSVCSVGPSCSEGSLQNDFLEQDLAATTENCIIAFWHAPLFNSGGVHSGSESVLPLWEDLYAAGADIVVNGHEHNYQRFAKQAPDGTAVADGIREFVVGTGGARLYALATTPEPNLEAGVADSYGVLRLSLADGSYSWEFVGVDGDVLDSGGPVACN
ncbi:MAG: DUF7594 domain-containing protein [Actinomycetota bacterium]